MVLLWWCVQIASCLLIVSVAFALQVTFQPFENPVRLTDTQALGRTDRQTDRQTDKQKDIQTGTDRQTDTRKDTHTDTQTDTQTHRHRQTDMYRQTGGIRKIDGPIERRTDTAYPY